MPTKTSTTEQTMKSHLSESEDRPAERPVAGLVSRPGSARSKGRDVERLRVGPFGPLGRSDGLFKRLTQGIDKGPYAHRLGTDGALNIRTAIGII